MNLKNLCKLSLTWKVIVNLLVYSKKNKYDENFLQVRNPDWMGGEFRNLNKSAFGILITLQVSGWLLF